LYWHPPLFYLLILLNLILYVIVAIFVRKKATVDVYLCHRHARRRKYFIIAGWSGAGLGIAMIIGGFATNEDVVTGLGGLIILPAIIVGLIGASLTRATRIKGDTVWLSGAGREFLASLPPWT
jgi:hypothetical protein